MRNASDQQGENERQQKRKANRNTYDTSSIKRVTRKCHVVVMQNNGNEFYQQVCCTCNVAIVGPIDFWGRCY